MAKLRAKDQQALVVLGLLVGVPVFIFQRVTEAGAWPFVIGALVVGCALYLLSKVRKRANRLKYLRGRYSEETIVQSIFKGNIWDGMTQGQLTDSIGRPSSIDQKYLKTKTREVWKYYPQGKNRYGLRVTLDDGRVNGWDAKG